MKMWACKSLMIIISPQIKQTACRQQAPSLPSRTLKNISHKWVLNIASIREPEMVWGEVKTMSLYWFEAPKGKMLPSRSPECLKTHAHVSTVRTVFMILVQLHGTVLHYGTAVLAVSVNQDSKKSTKHIVCWNLTSLTNLQTKQHWPSTGKGIWDQGHPQEE